MALLKAYHNAEIANTTKQGKQKQYFKLKIEGTDTSTRHWLQKRM